MEKCDKFVCESDLPTLKNSPNFLQRCSHTVETKAGTYRLNYQKTSQAKYNGNPKSHSLFTGVATSTNKNSQRKQPSEIYK